MGNGPGGAPFVVLGVGGGIAAYKAVELCRLLVDAGCHVAPVMTEAATQFVGPLTFTALASEPCQRSVFGEASPIPHTRLGQLADLIVVAPATADLLARAAAGLADDLLTTTLVATRAQVLFAPAMHTEMWEHASVRENLATLVRRGAVICEPDVGRLAGGDVGAGRLAAPAAICGRALEVLGANQVRDLLGHKVVVTAGGTREAIDPVRFLSNRSSGKQGLALAEEAARRGAEVVLITAAKLTPSMPMEVVEVTSAAEMAAATKAAATTAQVVVMAAAVADYRPRQVAPTKLTKDGGIPVLELEETEDILAALVAQRTPGQVLVGFAAETHDVHARATAKLARKGCDLLVVNDVSQPEVGFDHDTNAVSIVDRSGEVVEVPLTTKVAVARAVFDRVAILQTSQGRARTT